MKAKLIYGFEIGVPGNWKVQEAQEDQGGQRPNLITSWYNDVDNYPNFRPLAWDRLFAAMPFAPDGTPEAQRESMARAYYGVTFEDAGPENNRNAALAVIDLRFEVDEPAFLGLNPGALQARPIGGRYSEKLRRALNILGLTPVQSNAAWLLASYTPTI